MKNETKNTVLFSDLNAIKNAANRLKQQLSLKNIDIKYSDSLEIVAKQFGYKNYNTMKALVEKEIMKLNKKVKEFQIECKNDLLKEKIINEINKSIKLTKQLNDSFEYELVVSNDNIKYITYFDSDKSVANPYELSMVLISQYQKELLSGELSCIKTEHIDFHQTIDLKISLINALNKLKSGNNK